MKKVIFIIVLLLAFGFWYSSNSYTTEPVINHISETVDDYIVPKEKCYHYSQLDENGKLVYDELLRQVPGGVTVFSIKGIPEETMQGDNFETIVDAFYKDHPEFFWIYGGYEWTYFEFFDRLDVELYVNEFWDDKYDKDKMVDEFFNLLQLNTMMPPLKKWTERIGLRKQLQPTRVTVLLLTVSVSVKAMQRLSNCLYKISAMNAC